jgi:hypothetical protein
MSDYILVDPPPNQSTIQGLLVAETDGVCVAILVARAEGNGHATPSMWSVLSVNNAIVKKTEHIAWKDGPAEVQLAAPFSVKAGGIYEVRGVAGNENADATDMSLEIKRVQ